MIQGVPPFSSGAAVRHYETPDARDMPAGTIITQPYFSDYPVMVVLKQTP